MSTSQDWLSPQDRKELDEAWDESVDIAVANDESETTQRDIFRALARNLGSREFSADEIERYLDEKAAIRLPPPWAGRY